MSFTTTPQPPASAPAPTKPDVLGRRIAAALIDLLALLALLIVVGIAFGQTHSSNGTASVNLHGASFLLWAALGFLYYLIPEAAGGQTLGKLLVGIRVVRTDGGRPSFGAILVRTLLRVVDGLPFLYLVGLVTVLATGQRRQRVGDLAAGTTVTRKDGISA